MFQDNTLFALDKVNKGRQAELDIIKGLSILFMFLVHCLEELTSWQQQPTVSTYIIRFLGSPPAAPVFMFALGVGIVYSRKSNARVLALRGVHLLILGYGLNFLRDFLPELILYAKTGDGNHLSDAVTYLLGVDILQFAGLTFLFFGASAKLKFTDAHYALSAVVLAGINLLVLGRVPQDPVVRVVSGSFWGTNEYTWFPFLTWIFYPILGYLFGQLLIRCTDKGRLYKAAFWASLPVLALFTVYSFSRGADFGETNGLYWDSYYHHDLMGNIVIASFVLLWTSMAHFALPHLPGIVKGTLSRWSRNITTMYCVHWLIIGWSLLIEPDLALPWMLAYFVALLALTDFVSVRYLRIKSRIEEQIGVSRGQRAANR